MIVTSEDVSIEKELIGVRFRSFANTSGSELYTGLIPLAAGSSRVDTDLIWEEENFVMFAFDREADKLVAAVSNESGTTDIEFTELSEALFRKGHTYTVDDFTVMQITVVNQDKESEILFSDVKINEQSLDLFLEDTNENNWMVIGIDFSQSFTLTGKIELSGPFSRSQERSVVEIKLGSLSDDALTAVPTNTPQPTATNTSLPTATNTPLPTATNTAVPTNTPQPTATNTSLPTATNTPLPTATNTAVPTNTPQPTATNTAVPTNTPQPTATNTSLPTATNTAVPTNTPQPTATNTAVPTNTPLPTVTATPVPTGIPSDAVDRTAYQLFLPFVINP
ncbi:MAG: hypothetical protein KC419_26740 [Anaerolineales bacterium]|nr:hypothetical protein [Anaerolineales bacterium]